MVVAHLSVTALPADGTSVGRYVRRAVEVLRERGVRHDVHAMGTEIEAPDLEALFETVIAVDRALLSMGAQRVTIQLKVDHRVDRPAGMADKVRSATGAR